LESQAKGKEAMTLLALLLTPFLPLLFALAALWSYFTGAWDGGF
jgi:hypothetical protein